MIADIRHLVRNGLISLLGFMIVYFHSVKFYIRFVMYSFSL
jgi:hypothetical protein